MKPLWMARAIIPVLWLLFSATAQADLSLRYDRLNGPKHQPVQQIRLAHGMLRIDPIGGPPMSLLVDLNGGRLIQLRHDRRRYFSIPLSTLLQYGSLYENNRSVFQGLVDQALRQLDPDQREQAERFLAQLKHPRRGRIQLKPLGRKRRVLGAECTAVALLQPGMPPRELCVSRYRDLQLDEGDRANLERIGQLAETLRRGGMSRWFDGVVRTWKSLQGLPLEIRGFDRQGRLVEHLRAGRLSRSPIPANDMQIPADYEASSTPLI